MKTQNIGVSSLVGTRLAYGSARLGLASGSEERRANALRCFYTAYDAGYTFFDHADVYGSTMSETVFGQALKERPGMRDKIVVATKCTVVGPDTRGPGRAHCYDSSREHILWSCEESLRRLGTDRIDLYQLHRPDLLIEPMEVAQAFDILLKAGKVRAVGVCNYLPSFFSMLQKFCPMALVVNQVEISLARLDCFYDGTLDQCIERHVTPLAYSPVGGGMLGTEVSAKVEPSHPRPAHLPQLHTVMNEVAERHGVSRTVIAIAWLLRHPSRMIPIVGTTRPERIIEAAQADAIDISRDDWYRLLVAARGKGLP